MVEEVHINGGVAIRVADPKVEGDLRRLAVSNGFTTDPRTARQNSESTLGDQGGRTMYDSDGPADLSYPKGHDESGGTSLSLGRTQHGLADALSCWNPACTKKSPGTTNKFKHCSRCKRARYCR